MGSFRMLTLAQQLRFGSLPSSSAGFSPFGPNKWTIANNKVAQPRDLGSSLSKLLSAQVDEKVGDAGQGSVGSSPTHTFTALPNESLRT